MSTLGSRSSFKLHILLFKNAVKGGETWTRGDTDVIMIWREKWELSHHCSAYRAAAHIKHPQNTDKRDTFTIDNIIQEINILHTREIFCRQNGWRQVTENSTGGSAGARVRVYVWLFNEVFSVGGIDDGRWYMNNELERSWEKAVLA
jgi:hypothetical protein